MREDELLTISIMDGKIFFSELTDIGKETTDFAEDDIWSDWEETTLKDLINTIENTKSKQKIV